MSNWIKIEHVTPDKPEIVSMAELLKIDQDAVTGKCLRIWIWADQQTIEGDDLRVTPAFLDRLTNCPGFSSALVEVGWMKSRNSRFTLPNFSRHNGQTAKTRALTSDRVKRQRNEQIVTQPLPDKNRSDKRRKNPKKDSPPAARERDPIWDSIVASFGFKEPHPPSEASRIGKVVRDLKIKGATPEEIARRHANAIKSWDGKPFGPEALVKHWDALIVVAGLQNATFGATRKAEYIP